MIVPLSQDPAQLLGFAGLLILAAGMRRRRRFQDFLRFVRDALYDEWNRPR